MTQMNVEQLKMTKPLYFIKIDWSICFLEPIYFIVLLLLLIWKSLKNI